jgi:hypothetical protein
LSLPPNGQRVVWDLLNIFRFDDQGRLVEEWCGPITGVSFVNWERWDNSRDVIT